MNRKQVLGRASLSFPANEGLLDIDQILETEPWNDIGDFAQRNFMQNILNEFNNRVTVDPKHTPTDNKSSAKKWQASSSRTARKSQTGRTAGEKSAKEKNDRRAGDTTNPRGHRIEEVANKGESSAKERSKKKRILGGKENKEKPIIEKDGGKQKVKGEPKGETSKAKRLSVNRQKTRNVSTLPVGKQPIATTLNNSTEKLANGPFRKTENMGTKKKEIKREPKMEYSMARVDMSKYAGSTSSFKTSTPKREKSQISNSLGKKAAIAWRNVVAPKKDAFAKKHLKLDLNDNCTEIIAAENGEKKVAAKDEHEPVALGKIKKEKEPNSNVTARAAKSGKRTETSTCATDGSGKIGTTKNKKIGKLEERLQEKRDRRDQRKIRRHERKAERAMEEYGHHVMRIVKQMDDSSRDSSSDNDCCCNSSDEWSYSDSCCTNSSCSCCTTCSSQYTEYTLSSSSD